MNRSLRLGLFIIIGIVIYAYGFTVTQVNLDELDSPARQESLTRIIRALARPDLHQVVVGARIDGPHDTVDNAGIVQEILAETLAGAMLGSIHGAYCTAARPFAYSSITSVAPF